MSVKERDPLTGHQTTGHEWNGITELNTPVPMVIWWFIGITHLYAVIAWILLPAFPLVTTYTKGILGLDQQEVVDEKVLEAREERADWSIRIADTSLEDIRSDPGLMQIVDQTGPALFGDNCAMCHGTAATGGPGYPSLVDRAWLWGSGDDEVLETLRVGVNSEHPDTRYSEMLAFEGILSRDEIRTVAAYVQSLSGLSEPDPETLAAGAQLFADNCSSCHGQAGSGNTDLGAPNLTDDFWIYGGDEEVLFDTVLDGRQGHMPAWEDRLSLVDRKILALYLLGLGKAGR